MTRRHPDLLYTGEGGAVLVAVVVHAVMMTAMPDQSPEIPSLALWQGPSAGDHSAPAAATTTRLGLAEAVVAR